MQDKLITYVYDGNEVYLTGRIAKPQHNKKKTTMVEIVPVGTDRGDVTYSKWVSVEDLLVISNLEESDDDEIE